MYVNFPALNAGCLCSLCGMVSRVSSLYYADWQLASTCRDTAIPLFRYTGFLLPISFDELFPRSLPCWCILPFLRTPLHYLLSLIYPEVISILPQRPSQGLYWYDQFCFHSCSLSISFASRSHRVRHCTIAIKTPPLN